MEHDGEFSAFASARWATLVRSAVFLGCTVEEAQDLAQSTLLQCYTSWRKVEKADNRDAYVYRMLLNLHRDSRRRRWWGERPTGDLPERAVGETPTDEVLVADAVHRALGDLSKAHREVVVLRYFANLSEHETSAALGIAAGTVKSRLSRALATLAGNSHLSDVSEGP